MASENETTDAAIAAVRKMIHECPLVKGGIAEFRYQLEANGAIDRIEAAHKRDVNNLKMLNDNEHTITSDAVTYNENDGVNAIVKEWRERPISVHTEPEESARLDKLHNAYYAEMREVAELKTAYDRAVSADARHAVENERLRSEVAELRECLRIIRNNLLSYTIKSNDGKYVNNGGLLSEEFVDDERWRKALEGAKNG